MKKRLLIVDEQTAPREMLAQVLAAEGEYEIVGEANNGRDAIETCRSCRPDAVILELVLPELCGVEVLRRLRSESANVRILVFSGTRDQALIVETLKCRPHGFVGKHDALATFLEALRIIVAGKLYFSAIASALWADSLNGDPVDLTPREIEILQLVAESRSNKEIAGLLGLAQKTVENHRAHMMEKLHLHDVAALTRYAVRRGLVSLE
jgi:DNA-binding NarL/FixJ family response regulator